MTDDPPRTQAALRPVIARLKEIERKCASMGSRNEEFPLMQERVASIIARLETGSEPSGEPPDYAAMARELFPVAHVFESVGFMSIGKEIAHVERTLRELAPAPSAVPGDEGPAARSTARTRPQAESAGEVRLEERDSEQADERTPVPVPVVIGLVALVAAVAVAAAIITGIGPFERREAAVEPPPTAVPPEPTPTPPTPSPTPAEADEGSTRAARLADEIAQARLAVGRGDLDAAGSHLSAAALIDRDNAAVLEIAESVVGLYVESANAAAHAARWDDAAQRLERARRTAMRFGLAVDRIDQAAELHASMERFVVIGPDQSGAVREAVGRRVDVFLRDGDVRSGTIDGLQGGTLILDVAKDLGGGLFHYSDEIPLADVEVIKIYEQ